MLRYVPIHRAVLILGCVFLLAACAPAGIYHTVKPGQTLYRIAKTYEIDEDRLARINGIKDPTQLKASQRLFIPGVIQLRKVPVTAATSPSKTRTAVAAPAATVNKLPKTTTKAATKTVQKPAPKKSPVAKTAPSAKPSKGVFIWPVQGKLLNKFGKQDKKVYKGIELGVPKGTQVLASASGKVIYSGNAIPGYGNLVILEHSDSYFSIYGYNHENLVKMDDHVGQGEKVALSGVPPNGQSARLHFEIRKGKSAVNPILYLP